MINKIFGLFLLLALVSCEETKPESENGQDIGWSGSNFTIAGNINHNELTKILNPLK